MSKISTAGEPANAHAASLKRTFSAGPWWKKLLGGLAVCLMFFAILELGCLVTGKPTLLETEDPFMGFSDLVSAFERNGDEYRTRPAIAGSTINDQSFLVEKPQNGVRIFCLGGSSSYGFPWDARVAFGSILSDVLTASHPELHIEVVNASGLSYAMHRLNIVADELLTYDPDIFIVYSGHNEFIEPAFFEALRDRGGTRTRLEFALAHSRVYAAMHRLFARNRCANSRAAEMFDAHVRRDQTRRYTTAEKEAIVTEFLSRLARLVRRAQDSGVHALLTTVPCNLSEWRPEQSVTGATLSTSEVERWRELAGAGKEALSRGRAARATSDLEQAVRLAPEYAETHYWLARAYEDQRLWDHAREEYRLACDLDASPSRRVSAINNAIKRVAQEQGSLLVDLDQVYEAHSENGLVGFSLIEDYVHPTRGGHELIAWHLWDALEQAGWLARKARGDRTVFDRVIAERNSKPITAPSPSWIQNQGILLWKKGKTEAAIQKFRQAVELAPEYAGVRVNLGTLLTEMGRHKEAMSTLERALQIDPDDAEVHNALASALVGLARVQDAESHYREALRLQPGSAKIHNRLGNLLQSIERLEDAKASYREALRLEPDLAAAHNGLAITLIREGSPKKAVAHLQKALAINPDDETARRNLATLTEQLAVQNGGE